jgi:membrane fusion protein (multidrug efflux system)
MPAHFSRSLNRLNTGQHTRQLFALVILAAFALLWCSWLLLARVAVYASSEQARLEVDRENHPVDAPVAGRIISAPMTAGRRVEVGEILVELDSNAEKLARGEAVARVDPATQQIRSLRAELRAAEDAMGDEDRGILAAKDESAAHVHESRAGADQAADEAKRLKGLHGNGLVSELELTRAERIADERQSEAQAATFAASRLERDLDARRHDRLARIARLENEIAAAEGARGGAFAASARLGYEIEQRVVRAPVAGVIAEVSHIRAGSMVRAGDRLCTIVPDGVLKVVAFFAPSVALGRLHDGQSARVRLDGFPWTQYGSAGAIVTTVAGELRDGQVRVELTLDSRAKTAVPLQHGLPAEVDVEVEHTSPMNLVLRSAGLGLRARPLSPIALAVR